MRLLENMYQQLDRRLLAAIAKLVTSAKVALQLATPIAILVRLQWVVAKRGAYAPTAIFARPGLPRLSPARRVIDRRGPGRQVIPAVRRVPPDNTARSLALQLLMRL